MTDKTIRWAIKTFRVEKFGELVKTKIPDVDTKVTQLN